MSTGWHVPEISDFGVLKWSIKYFFQKFRIVRKVFGHLRYVFGSLRRFRICLCLVRKPWYSPVKNLMPLTQKKVCRYSNYICDVTNKVPLAILKSKWAKYTNNKTTAMVESMVFPNKNVGKRSTTSFPGSSLFLPSRGNTQVDNPRNEVELSIL